MKEMMDLLQMYGGWACTTFLAYAIIKLYSDFRKIVWDKEVEFQKTIAAKDVLLQNINTENHKEIVAVVRECTAVLTTVSEVLEHCREHSKGKC